MRTSVEIDETLLRQAMAASGQPNESAAIEEALRRLVQDGELRRVIDEMKGLGWEGDLDGLREGRRFGSL